MSEGDNSTNTGKLSRRDFLAHARDVIGGGLIAEGVFRPLGLTLERTDAGSITNRIGITDKLARELVQNRSEENQELFLAWLKFNAAEMYMLTQNQNLTAATVRHFLFGEGKPLDISTLYKEAVVKGKYDRGPEPDSDTKLAHLLEDGIQSTVYAAIDNPLWRSRVMVKEKPDDSGRIKFAAIINSSRHSRDLETSLNTYTILVDGTVTALQEELIPVGPPLGDETLKDPTSMTNLTVASPKIVLYDMYDWEKTRGLEDNSVSTANLLTIALSKLMPDASLANLIGEERYEELREQKWSIRDWEGALLAEKGYAQTYEVIGKIETKAPIEISIPTEWLK